jgi:hypothetical protein
MATRSTSGRRWLAASAVGFEAGLLLGEHLAGPGEPLGRHSTALLAAIGVAVGVGVLGGLILDKLRHPLTSLALLVFGVLGVIFHGAPRAMVHVGFALVDADVEDPAARAALVSDEAFAPPEAQHALARVATAPRVEAAITFMEAALWSPLSRDLACTSLTRLEWRLTDATDEVGNTETAARWRQSCAGRSCQTAWVAHCQAVR